MDSALYLMNMMPFIYLTRALSHPTITAPSALSKPPTTSNLSVHPSKEQPPPSLPS